MPSHGITDKKGPNKKRPKLSRVMGRPNSPPPKSAHMQSTINPLTCKFHLRAKGWHEGAICDFGDKNTLAAAFRV